MLDAVEETAHWTRDKICAMRSLMDETVRHVRTAAAEDLQPRAGRAPFHAALLTTGDLVDVGLGNRARRVSKYLKELVEAGVLRRRKAGREKLYLNVRFLDLLMSDSNEFAPFPHLRRPRDAAMSMQSTGWRLMSTKSANIDMYGALKAAVTERQDAALTAPALSGSVRR